MKPMKIIRVTKTEFETEDGQIVPHPVPLDKVPTVKQFQKIYDSWFSLLQTQGLVEEDDGKSS
jgi:hypothetical protein